MKISMQYTRNPEAPSRDKFHALLQKEPGYYLPLREQFPARIKATGPAGPYRPEMIRTLPGIYNALVWGGGNSSHKVLQHQRIVFTSWDDLSSTVDSIIVDPHIPVASRADPYFCSAQPYGHTNRNRNIEQAKVYWASMCDRKWTEFTSSHTRPTFSATLQYFQPRRDNQDIF